jgi:hypothetical protein
MRSDLRQCMTRTIVVARTNRRMPLTTYTSFYLAFQLFLIEIILLWKDTLRTTQPKKV